MSINISKIAANAYIVNDTKLSIDTIYGDPKPKIEFGYFIEISHPTIEAPHFEILYKGLEADKALNEYIELLETSGQMIKLRDFERKRHNIEAKKGTARKSNTSPYLNEHVISSSKSRPFNLKENWLNLIERKQLIEDGESKEWLQCYPLDPGFIQWVKGNQDLVETILENGTTGKLQRPGSPLDIAHSLIEKTPEYMTIKRRSKIYHLKEMELAREQMIDDETLLITSENIVVKHPAKPYLYEHRIRVDRGYSHAEQREVQELFPVSAKTRDERMKPDLPEILEWIDQRIAEWNPKLKTVDPDMKLPALDYDEYGHDIAHEYVQAREIIGNMENDHFVGIDEYGYPAYRDFDSDGHFLPMGNPDNSTDYQDDFDPQEYAPEQWKSIDDIDDHHVDSYYREKCITERPQFDEDGMIEWKTETHSDIESPRPVSDDMDFVTDARNWLTRENLMRETDDWDSIDKIADAYPVSRQFLDYIKSKEIDFETAHQRMQELLGDGRETLTDDEPVETVDDLPVPSPNWDKINSELQLLDEMQEYAEAAD